MRKNIIEIICTRPLSPEISAKTEESGISIESIDFLNIKPKPSSDFQCTLLSNEYPLVFTSTHAVHAVTHLIQKLKSSLVFAIEGKTSKSAENIGFKIIATAANGEKLAEEIINHRTKAVLHCTTNRRRVELENGLVSSGVAYYALEVYEKELVPHKIDRYDGIMFYSPTQVDAFLMENTIGSNVPVFCIGNTTAEHLVNLKHKNLIVAEGASTEQLVQAVLKFFKRE